MLLQRKIDRAMKWSRDRGLRAEGVDPEKEEIQAELRKHSAKKEEIPSMEELIAQEKQKELEKVVLEVKERARLSEVKQAWNETHSNA